ncbi:S8 family serine peptidase [Phytomonospora endophytica]|uniref:Subtilisin family serine protease n=1 Tax=Phytomonospora endophytica TaxID=714109 RepID=A0A841FKU2_9ACTN|nr:S8 family serine peptidase [Phytomonospora endophytica]MBB6032570.1 subtilisin family serine protease [Phytomonospora endophytica]GIG66280.1 serine protease [Phytomonospora endophytica]
MRTRPTPFTRLFTGVAALAVAAGTVVAAPVAALAAGPPADSPDTSAGSVTLITGDVVTVRWADGQEIPDVRPAPGRADVDFEVRRRDGHLHVLPADALRPVAEGRVDARLFDITALLAAGHGDERSGAVPLIVRGGTVAGVTARIPGLGMSAVAHDKDDTSLWRRLAEGDVDRVWLDGVRQVTLAESVPQIRAPQAWEAGYDGAGITVAVLDTGVDATHPDLAGRIAGSRNFTEAPDVDDTVGHGTHVASTIVGSGAASQGRYKGVAPGAELLIGKVCPDTSCPDSAVLAGMEWAAKSGADVVNLSLGGPDTPGIDPLEQAVADLSAAYGTLFVTAAGNSGADASVDSPGSADAALTVGAVDKSGVLAEFSSRGPRLGDSALKPDITAPGVGIVAAKAANGWLGEPAGDGYVSMDGTSMATPHVAGAAAILKQRHPGWSGQRLKSALMGSAVPAEGVSPFAQGAGLVDVAAAVERKITAVPGSISAGVAQWPHADDAPVTRTLTYRNSGKLPVVLRLSVAAIGPDGATAPAGTFTLDRTRLTVPGKGTAKVKVTVDTRRGGPDGLYTGRVTATGPGNAVTTPIAVDKEPESYDLTLTVTDRDGSAASDYVLGLVDLDRLVYHSPYDADGTVTLRLQKGRYHLDAVVYEPGQVQSRLTRPTFALTADTTLAFDAADAKRVTITVPDPSVSAARVTVGYQRLFPGGAFDSLVLGSRLEAMYTGTLGEPSDELTALIAGTWAVRGEDGTTYASPVAFHLTWYTHGSLPNGFVRDATYGDLARINTTYRSQGEGKSGNKGWIATDPRGWSSGIWLRVASLPTTRTEYHNLADGMMWRSEFEQVHLDAEGLTHTEHLVRTGPYDHVAGGVYFQTVNSAVTGPGLRDWGSPMLYRAGDAITADAISLTSDATPESHGYTYLDSSRTALYREGTLVKEFLFREGFGFFPVPAAEAGYRLEAEAVRSESPFSTRVEAVWTFRSGHSDRPCDDPEPLPLTMVRFAPEGLDLYNYAPAGAAVRVPITVQHQTAAGLASLSVEVSFDDGGTWTPAAVDGMALTIDGPSAPGFVSLRVTATDTEGNTAEHTIIRAYGVR